MPSARLMTPVERSKAISKFEMLHAAQRQRARFAEDENASKRLAEIGKQIETLRADWPVTKKQIDALVAERTQLQKQAAKPPEPQFEQQLRIAEAFRQMPTDDPRFSAIMQDPRAQALRAQTAIAQADFAPTAADAEAAWEAWLQNGGEAWERWERDNGPKLERAMAQRASLVAGWNINDLMATAPAGRATEEDAFGGSGQAKLAARDAHLAFRAKIASVLGRVPGSAPAGQ
jgi:hypothetical protein